MRIDYSLKPYLPNESESNRRRIIPRIDSQLYNESIGMKRILFLLLVLATAPVLARNSTEVEVGIRGGLFTGVPLEVSTSHSFAPIYTTEFQIASCLVQQVGSESPVAALGIDFADR